MIKMRQKLDWPSRGKTLTEILKWIKNAKITKLKRRIMYSFIAAAIYHIWRVRNDVMWLGKVWTIENTVYRIVNEIKGRLKCTLPKKATKIEREWVDNLCTKV